MGYQCHTYWRWQSFDSLKLYLPSTEPVLSKILTPLRNIRVRIKQLHSTDVDPLILIILLYKTPSSESVLLLKICPRTLLYQMSQEMCCHNALWRKPLRNLELRILYLCSHFLGYELFQIENIWEQHFVSFTFIQIFGIKLTF